MEAATPIAAGRPRERGRAAWHPVGAPAWQLRAAASISLGGIVACLLLLCAGAAHSPNQFVPAQSGGWPAWLAGPLSGVGIGLSGAGFQALMIAMCACYVLALLSISAISARMLAAAIVAAHLILVLGPPLLSQDVFGYIAFARLGALHDLDPYTNFAAQAAGDPVYRFIGWPFLHSPYGPLFTLASYWIGLLGLASALWAMKLLAAACSLAAIALIARAAGRLGRSSRAAAAFVGLNPVLLVPAVGGAHNDTVVIMLVGLSLMLTAGAERRPAAAGASLAAGVGVKVTAGLALPFMYLGSERGRERRALLAGAALALAGVVLIGVIGFGSHVLGFLVAISEQQQLVSTHSVPAETARLLGLSGTPGWWRHLFVLGFLAVFALTLVRTARGADWRTQAGWATLALVASTAWLLPWYAIWLLPLAALSSGRRLKGATLLLCAYAVTIHLAIAEPLLSPASPRPAAYRGLVFPAARQRLELTGFQVFDDVKLDLRW